MKPNQRQYQNRPLRNLILAGEILINAVDNPGHLSASERDQIIAAWRSALERLRNSEMFCIQPQGANHEQ